MSILVDGRAVPVVWKPSDITGPDSDGHAGRFKFGKSGVVQSIRAIVHHRVVGTLESMTNYAFKPTLDNVLRAGERRVSSHFGIGFWDTQLTIIQYIALENTAYCNGQSDRDRTACTWRLWIDAGRPDANGMTISIEHEDNGATDGGDGRYVVREEIIQASIELDRLLLSGDGPAIRAAGIRCSDAAAAQLGRIEPSTQTLVDHNVVAPISKPYCWRAIGDDDGFPQARYITALTTAQESVMYVAQARPGNAAIAKGARVSGYSLAGASPRVVKVWENRDASSFRFTHVAWSEGNTSPSPLLKAEDADGFFGGLWVPTSQVVETYDKPTAYTQAQVDQTVAEAITADRAKARITYQEG